MDIRAQVYGCYGVFRKEVMRVIRIWPQSLLPSPITMVLYFLIFGHVIGSRVGTMDGVSYIRFIMPGLVMMAIILNSYSNVVSSFFGSKFNRSIEELLVSPLGSSFIMLGFIGGGVFRGLLVGCIVLGVGILFTHSAIAHGFLMVLVMVLCSSLFALAGILNGIIAQKFDDTAIVTTFILTPLIYLGGVFYSTSLLSPFWQKLTLLDPILYTVELFRYCILGLNSHLVFGAVMMIVVLWFLLFFTCWTLLQRGFRIKS